MPYPAIADMLKEVLKAREKEELVKVARGEGDDRFYTGAEILAGARAFAAGLQKNGFASGERVAIFAKPQIQWLYAYLGSAMTGLVAVLIDPSLTKQEVQRILAQTKPHILVSSRENLEKIQGHNIASIRKLLVLGNAQGKFARFQDFLGDKPSFTFTDPESPAEILCTSGTTGDPKNPVLPHRAVTSNIVEAMRAVDFSDKDTILSIAPWHHSFGRVVLLGLIKIGARQIYTDNYKAIPVLLKKHRVSVLIAVPKLANVMFARIEEKINQRLLARVLYLVAPKIVGRKVRQEIASPDFREILTGSAPSDPKVVRGFRKLGIGYINGYGLTETAPVVSVGEPFGKDWMSVGRPIPGTRVKILNPDEQGIGEICVKGPGLMLGYFNNPEATAQVIDEDGWFRTGDLGSIDSNGRVIVSGRKKNVIVLEGGKNVFPEEVEQELAGRLPLLKEFIIVRGRRQGKEIVRLVGVPDSDKIEAKLREQSVVSPRGFGLEDALQGRFALDLVWEEVKAACENLSPFKRIRSKQDIRLVAELEKTSTADVKRYIYQE